MPASDIQVIPPGLLGFFQLKNAGRNPSDLIQTLQPTLDLFDWYMQARSVDFTQNGGGNVASTCALATGVVGFQPFTVSPIVVPTDEWWWVEEFSIFTTLAAATNVVDFGCGFSTPITGTPNYYLVSPMSGLRAGAAVARAALVSARGFFAPPASSLGVMVGAADIAAGTTTFTGMVRFTPLPT